MESSGENFEVNMMAMYRNKPCLNQNQTTSTIAANMPQSMVDKSLTSYEMDTFTHGGELDISSNKLENSGNKEDSNTSHNDNIPGMENIIPNWTSKMTNSVSLTNVSLDMTKIDEYELYVDGFDEERELELVAPVYHNSIEGGVVNIKKKKGREEERWEDYIERDESYRNGVKRLKGVEERMKRRIAEEMRKDVEMIKGKVFDKSLAYFWGKELCKKKNVSIVSRKAFGR
ncbi:9489_t:CDS:1, partial [Paraglomus occultum]